MVAQKNCLLVFAILFISAIPQSGFAQEQEAKTTAEGTDSRFVIIETEQDTPAPSLLEKVDGLFGSAVGVMEKVLFYRLGRSERDVIVFERTATYQRPVGSEGPFLSVGSQEDGQPLELTDSQAEVLAAQEKLLPGHTIDGEAKNYKLGTLDGKAVEFVSLKRDGEKGQVEYGSRFILTASGDFQILEEMRSLPGKVIVSQKTIDDWANRGFLKTNPEPEDGKAAYLFTEPQGGIPVVVAWLALGGVFFTLFMRGFNFWGFRHAIDIVRGKYDNPNETGEVTHFQALASALSATIGLGNIAGVTIAMTLGGPGAFFWMLLCGLLGMCTKFVECTLGQKYRHVNPDGTVLGGPMRYLKVGLAEMKLGLLGSVLSVVFAVMCLLASFGGGNMLQANQSGSAMLQMFQRGRLDEITDLKAEIKTAADAKNLEEVQTLKKKQTELKSEVASFAGTFKVIYGLVLAGFVGAVIIGGIKRIGAAASKIVPSMCIMYSLACLYIISMHLAEVPALIGQVFSEAFSGAAMGGGLIGVLVVGVQRAAFSNEAGAGSAAIAHSAAKTEEPVREGCVALLGPFIDTIVVCSMTALVILITGAWDNSAWLVDQGLEGAALTSKAFEQEISWFPILLSIAVTLFAYSTIISWSYYGEKAWETLFGARSTFLYKILAVICVFVGTIVNLGSVLDFSDFMILGMAFPNILGVVLLSPKVRKDLLAYWDRYKAGAFQTYK